MSEDFMDAIEIKASDTPQIEREYSLSDKLKKTANSPFLYDNVARHNDAEAKQKEKDLEELEVFRQRCIDMGLKYNTLNPIGKRIQHLLDVREISVPQLAQVCKINRTSINRFLNGDIPKAKTMASLCDGLECPIYLWTYDPEETYENWENECDQDFRLRLNFGDVNDLSMPYSKVKELILAYTRYNMTDEDGMRIPTRFRMQLQQQLLFAFDTMDMLLEQLHATEEQKKKTLKIR